MIEFEPYNGGNRNITFQSYVSQDFLPWLLNPEIRSYWILMTWANRITILRLILIPFFVGSLLYYEKSAHTGAPVEAYRLTAIAIFILAGLSDALDGYLARHFKQKSKLGTILDPIADKLLMFSALICLSLINGPQIHELPLWFPIVVIVRDFTLLLGTVLLHYFVRDVHISPHWTGKVSTFFVLLAISAAMLNFDWTIFFCYAGGFFTVVCTIIYIRMGLRQFQHGGFTEAGGHQ